MTWYIHRFNGSKLTGDVERPTEATQVNDEGVVEVVGAGVPRVEGEPPTEKAPDPSKPKTRRTRKSRWPEDEATD